MVMLKEESDRNRFCFFMKDSNGNLQTYRYRTIVFGFTSSPFCLNYILKYHAAQYPQDEISNLLSNNLYVDNFIMTSNNPVFLNQVYTESRRRMAEGGFELRSWNTNESNLAKTLEDDGTKVTHDQPFEKVLGYEYHINSDTIRLSNVEISSECDTKRKILSEISKVYDPLGVFLPLTVRGKILMRQLWIDKMAWDQDVPAQYLDTWRKLASDLNELSSFEFPRNAVECENNRLVIFCDASKLVYGFNAYAVGESSSNLIFAKSKVSPVKSRSLPTLELLSVYLSLRCLESLLFSYNSNTFSSIIIAVDAQIVLSWVLSGTVKTKNQFTRNRVKDIHSMVAEIRSKFNIGIDFKYIRTQENPSDMLTRGFSIKEFEANFGTWLNGPKWLTETPFTWPEGNLGCLSETSKQSAQTTSETLNCAVPSVNNITNDTKIESDPVIDFQRYSSWNKLFAVVKTVFIFIQLFRKWINFDPNLKSREFIIKSVQKRFFSAEIAYLTASKDTPDKDAPILVKQLNLFLDNFGILRSKGRIGRSHYFSSEVINPIVLPGKSHVTSLIVNNFHIKWRA